MPILIDEILEKDQQEKHSAEIDTLKELSDLRNDEVLNRSALEILFLVSGFLGHLYSGTSLAVMLE